MAEVGKSRKFNSNKSDITDCVTSKFKEKNKSTKRSHSSSDSSSSSSSPKRKKKSKDYKKKLKKQDRKEKKKAKKLKKKLKKEKKRLRKKEASPEVGPIVGPDVSLASKVKAPMTKEEWEKEQNVIRRVYDIETGRNRLIKGSGEVLEECVSRERHKEINRATTKGDGNFFQASLISKLK